MQYIKTEITAAPQSKSAQESLTATWAFSESGLGGLLHALKIPFTGLWLTGVSLLCLSSLSDMTRKRSALIKAIATVLALKVAISPHASIGAFLAVVIQGAIAVILWPLHTRWLRIYSQSILSHWYSASQRLITLTVLFGEPFWTAFDKFLSSMLKSLNIEAEHPVWLIISMYFGIYTLSAIGVAGLAYLLPNRLHHFHLRHEDIIRSFSTHLDQNTVELTLPTASPKKVWVKAGLTALMLTLSVSIVALMNGVESGVMVLGRAVIVLAVWYVFIEPLMRVAILTYSKESIPSQDSTATWHQMFLSVKKKVECVMKWEKLPEDVVKRKPRLLFRLQLCLILLGFQYHPNADFVK